MKDLTIEETVKDEFLKALTNGGCKVFKDNLIRKLSSHEKLWEKSLRARNQSVTDSVYRIGQKWSDEDILIIPFPIFSSKYDGWQIVTDKTKISELEKQMEEEKYRKDIRRWYKLGERILKREKVAKKLNLLDEKEIKKIGKEERKPYKLLPYSYMKGK